jgi:hypothetical protein
VKYNLGVVVLCYLRSTNTFEINLMRFSSLFLFAATLGWAGMATAQVTTTVDCDLMGLVVNVGSDSNSVNLYHPGGYLTWPPAYNVMTWEFTDSEGNLIDEATIQDDNFIHVVHNLPVTDTLFVSVLLTNDSALHNGVPVACLIEDYLFWEVDTWPNSGEEYGTWTLGGSVGEDVSETSGMDATAAQRLEWTMFPQPAVDRLVMTGLTGAGTVTVLDLSGKERMKVAVRAATETLDVSELATGMYLVQVANVRGDVVGTRRMMVLR